MNWFAALAAVRRAVLHRRAGLGHARAPSRRACGTPARPWRARCALGPQGAEELVAEQIRLATRALERLTGRIGVEDILDVIFRDFCIGK